MEYIHCKYVINGLLDRGRLFLTYDIHLCIEYRKQVNPS